MTLIREHLSLIQNEGLSEKEARVYLALVQLGDSYPAEIARASGVKRPTVYLLVEELRQKGLVFIQSDGKKEILRAASPQVLLRKRQQACEKLEFALPGILASHSHLAQQPEVRTFYSQEDFYAVWQQMLDAKGELSCVVEKELRRQAGFSSSYQFPLKEIRLQRRLWLRLLVPYEPNIHAAKRRGWIKEQRKFLEWKKLGKREYREVRFLPRTKLAFENEITLFDNKILIEKFPEMTGTLITQHALSETLRAWFEAMFDYARLIEPELLSQADRSYLES